MIAKDYELDRMATDLIREVSFSENPPFYHIAGVSSRNVYFEKEPYSSCNLCEYANFDLEDGVYGWLGTYIVDLSNIYSMQAAVHIKLYYYNHYYS